MKPVTNDVVPDAQYMELMRDYPVNPVFVMGDHRSGTTILYEILSATGVFNPVSAYHIICYDELLSNHINGCVRERKESLNDLFRQKGLADRGFDRVEASASMPEEYGFILSGEGSRPQLRPGNRQDLVDLCQKIQFTSDSVRPVLLKNPWDYFMNFAYVKEAFPQSKFIFIHRDPVHTVDSQLRATRSLLAEMNEYVALVADWYRQLYRQPAKLALSRMTFSPRFRLGINIVIRHVARGTDYFLQYQPSLPNADYIDIRYEDLCARPESTVTAILDMLAIEARPQVDYGSYIAVRNNPPLKEVQRKRASIYERTERYCRLFDYGA